MIIVSWDLDLGNEIIIDIFIHIFMHNHLHLNKTTLDSNKPECIDNQAQIFNTLYIIGKVQISISMYRVFAHEHWSELCLLWATEDYPRKGHPPYGEQIERK